MKPDEVRDRCLLALFRSGGVVINLDTGNYFRLDAAAAQIFEVLTDARITDPTLEIATRLNIQRERAQVEVADVCAALAVGPARGMPTGPYHFHPDPAGYALWHEGKRALIVSGDDFEVAVATDSDVDVAHSPLLEFYMRALAPKIMFLRGLTVIHAAACANDGVLVAFAGLSGAGKTTTARAFKAAGATLVSEDLTVLQTAGRRPAVVLGAEVRVHAWARKGASELARGAASISSGELATMAQGACTELSALHFLDAQRRQGTEFQLSALPAPDALLSLIAHDFLGAASDDGWRRFFATAVEIASNTILIEATAPRGVESLLTAAKRQMSNWTSYVVPVAARSPSQA